MPAGPGVLGFAYFSAVKAAGYTGFALALKGGYGLRESPKPDVWAVGLARTGIGIVAGLSYGALWWFLLGKILGDSADILFYVFLLPVRFAEWSLLIWLFFDRGLHDRNRQWKWVGWGILCSYLLDAVGVFAAFVLPGGAWVC